MEINRNQYFLAGLVVLFLGLQLRLVDSYVLTEKATHFLAERTGHKGASTAIATRNFLLPAAGPPVRKELQPPDWLGYALISVGSVLILHSLSMKRPG